MSKYYKLAEILTDICTRIGHLPREIKGVKYDKICRGVVNNEYYFYQIAGTNTLIMFEELSSIKGFIRSIWDRIDDDDKSKLAAHMLSNNEE